MGRISGFVQLLLDDNAFSGIFVLVASVGIETENSVAHSRSTRRLAFRNLKHTDHIQGLLFVTNDSRRCDSMANSSFTRQLPDKLVRDDSLIARVGLCGRVGLSKVRNDRHKAILIRFLGTLLVLAFSSGENDPFAQ